MRLRDFLIDENGKASTTRLVLVTITLTFALIAITDIYQDIQVHDTIYDIIWVVFTGCLGSTAARTAISNFMEKEKPDVPDPK